MSNTIANTVTTNILPVQALYDPTTLAFITFIGPAGTPFTGSGSGVSSVNVSGGTTGLTTSGGPIVSSGTITIAGTLNVGNGGTGSTTANGALTNLLPTQTGNSGKFLTTDGTNTSWSTVGSGLTISTDNTTNASRYLTFTATTNGVITSENVSTALYFNPSSGSLTATTFVGALTGNASTATSATTSTNLAGGAGGSLPYQTGSGATTFLAAGSNGQYLVLSGGVPTWANLTTVTSFSAGTTGLTPSTSTSGAVTLAGTLNVANGGTGVTTSSGASSVVLRDANANTSANDFYEGFTNVAAAGTTITLTAASTPNFVITGSGGQTYKLPDATTIPTGAIYTFNNNQTSGAINVQNSSGTLVVSVPSGGFVEIILLTNSVAAGTWDYHFQAPSNVSWSTNTFSYAGSITNATWNGVSIGAIYGGTGQTSYTTGDTLYASASNTLSKLAIGSTGQVLTVSGGVPTWANTSSATTITDDTTTNATRYINFTSATSGSLTNIGTSSTKLQYNPSTGTITAPSVTTTSDATIHGLTVGLGGGSQAQSTAVGASALAATNTGGFNTAVGYLASSANTSGARNSSIGYGALRDTTTGSDLSAGGYGALIQNTTGSSNTALGASALFSNTTASNNTAVGYQAGYSNTTGTANNYFGAQTGYTATTANGVTAFGQNALKVNTASDNTAFGYATLFANTTGTNNTAVGGGAYGADGAALQNNTTGSFNTAIGHRALQANTTASNNTAVGYQAGYTNTTGTGLTALGYQALYNNTTGGNLTAIGFYALGSNTTAYWNVAIGCTAANSNTTGTVTAIGANALYSNTTGVSNVAVGGYTGTGSTEQGALYSNTTGGYNTAVGIAALKSNTTGNGITALGYQAGYSNTGNYNLFIGSEAGYSNTTGAGNTYVGMNSSTGNGAGYGATTGSQNTILGGYQGSASPISATGSNWIVLSDGAGTVGAYYQTTGANGWYQKNNATLWSITSDIRIKKNIVSLDSGLSVIEKLRPVEFDYIENNKHDIGFIAQEYQTVLPEQITEGEDGMLSLNQNLVPYLVKAIQELTAEVNSLKQKIGA